jgi:hypothetical protein
MADLFPEGPAGSVWNGNAAVPHPTGLTLEQLAEAKKLPLDFLLGLGVTDHKKGDLPAAIRIPYLGTEGETLAVRYRRALNGDGRFRWRSGDKVNLYGLDHLPAIRVAGWVLLVEGESDCWTAWLHGQPALGIPGKSTWQEGWRGQLVGLQVYLWQEPGADELTLKVSSDLPDLRIISAPTGIKDLSEAHLQGRDVAKLLEELKANAVPAVTIRKEKLDARVTELKEKAKEVLLADDPISIIKNEFSRLGYGGDVRCPMIVYLAATSRLLAMRTGSMPVHLLLHGSPSAGKSYTLNVVLQLLPVEAFHFIDAGSPRVLIYDAAPLQHRVVVFSEADSLPAGEDNPAASAIRNLLQDHRLHYKTTIKDKVLSPTLSDAADTPQSQII